MPLSPLSEATAARLQGLYADAEARLASAIADAVAVGQRTAERRFRELQRMVAEEVAQLEHQSRDWLQDQVPLVYHEGATAAAEAVGSNVANFTLVHREAMQALAETTWSDVLRSTRFLARDTKATLRRLGSDAAARTLLGEATASGAGRDLAAAVREQTGMLSIRYRNGAHHAVSDWADTLARTATANASNEGGFVQMKADRIGFAEAADGADCGLDAHGVAPFANGMILPLDEARDHPLAHARCSRSWSPRPDITNRTEARLAEPSESDRLAAALEERARAERANVNTAKGHFSVASEERRAARAARTPRQPRTPRAKVAP